VRQNYVEHGNPALAVRQTQHFVLQNRCSDDVRAFKTDSGGNGQGGVVGAGDSREFIFYNKGHSWMKDYKACIAKLDVDHQCAASIRYPGPGRRRSLFGDADRSCSILASN